jgi:hypothetical protein
MTKSAKRRRPQPAPQTFVRRADVRGSSFNAATGSFSAVIATETPVRRRGYDGDYLEILSLAPGAVRLQRLTSGAAPLLDSHRAGSTRDQIGIVTDARIESGRLVADGRLSSRDDVKPIASDLAGGTPPNVSVGYRVYASEESRSKDGTLIVTRTDWEPFEMSFVPIPADPKTYVRSQKGTDMDPEDIIENDDATIDNQRSVANDPLANRRAAPQKTMSDRHARMAYDLCARHDLPADFARQHIDDGVSLNEFRGIVISHIAERQAKTHISARTAFIGDERARSLGETIGNVLYARMSGKAPEGEARELMGRSMIELGAMLIEEQGERISWASRSAVVDRMLTRSDIGAGMHTTSDFPTLLAGAGTRVLLDSYKAAESPLKALARRRTAADFRKISLLRLSEAPRLQKVLESGELTYGSRSEAKEGFAVETYAKVFCISRQALINDDLGAFADSSKAWGRAAAETEADLLVGLLTANGGDGINLDDNNPIYATARGNKAASGADVSETTMDAARLAMRTMKGLDGKTLISVTPRHLVVGPKQETVAEKFLAAIAAAKTSDVNPFAGKMTLHVEPRFSNKAWRLFADKDEIETLIIAYLDGNEGPVMDTREGWSRLGMEFRCVLDVGVGFNDWRGTYLNPGA